MTHHLLLGLTDLFSPEAMGLLFAGMAIGMFMGMLPGLGVSLVLSLMLPFLYHMSVVPAVAMMLGAQAGSYYAASITAILLNTPGAPESFPTTLDGFPMAERGEAGRALAISATSTWAGGWIACVLMVALLQVSGSLAGLFHPPEFVAIILLALVLIGGLGEGARPSKVILSGTLGFMLSFVGSDPVTGVARFTFGLPTLLSGLGVVPFALGVFAMTQMVTMYGRRTAVAATASKDLAHQFRGQIGWGIRDTFANGVHVVRSAVLATGLGLIPGVGGFTANFLSYSVGRQTSRQGKQFGTGIPAGIASAEGSSLAKEVGSLIPAVALGLPSGVGMVIFIAALTILGVQPGPSLLRSQPSLPYSMMWVMAIAGLASCAIGLLITPWISRVTTLRGPVIFPLIVSLAVLGSFASATNFTGVVELLVFTAVGVVLRKLNYSVAAITIGLVLGRTFADNLHLTNAIYGWHFVGKSPLADALFVISAGLLIVIAVRAHRERVRTADGPAAALTPSHPVLEPVTDLVITVGATSYLVTALGYPSAAGRLPAVVAAVAAAAGAYRLCRWAWFTLRSSSLRTAAASAQVVPPPGPAGGRQQPAGPAGEMARERELRTATLVRGVAAEPSVAAGLEQQVSGPPSRTLLIRETVALTWIGGGVIAAYLFGFEVGLPLTVAAYCLAGLSWSRLRTKIIFAGGTSVVVLGMALGFVSLFHLTFTGLITGTG